VDILDSRLLTDVGLTDAPVDSPYTIVFLNASGQVLASSGFGYSTPAVHPGDEFTIIGKPFRVARAFPAAAAEVQLRHNTTSLRGYDAAAVHRAWNSLLRTEVTSLGPETVKCSFNGKAMIRMVDPLTYTLSYSSNGGQTFLPIGTVLGPETTSYVWTTSFAPNSTRQGLIRVEASDGFDVASASSQCSQ